MDKKTLAVRQAGDGSISYRGCRCGICRNTEYEAAKGVFDANPNRYTVE